MGDALQTGSGLKATISQGGTSPVTNNSATTNQTGTAHTATITQNDVSTFNRAYATQKNGPSGPGSNSATISQSNGSGGAAARGDSKTLVTGNVGNYAGTFQTGSGNKATVNQDGPDSKANLGEITQQGSTNTGTITQSQAAKSGIAQILQGVEPAPVVDVTGNNATINQDISTNAFAITKQLSNGNTADVDQSGINSKNNKSYITQGDGTDVIGQAGNTAVVSQNGGSGGESSANSATIVQTGHGNPEIAGIYQTNVSKNNVGSINQITGTGSDARIYQQYTSSDNKASITMYGNFHGGQIFQQYASSNNEATVKQGNASSASDHGVAYIYQTTNVSSSTATLNQNQSTGGAYNKGQIFQTGGSGTTTGNLATLTQENSYNNAGLKQTGTGSNTATVGQTGSYNVVGGPGTGGAVSLPNGSALQDGFKNSMTVTQMAATGTAAVHNTALLSQTGTNTLTVDQTINAGATSGNMATATQMGMGNLAIVQQTAAMP